MTAGHSPAGWSLAGNSSGGPAGPQPGTGNRSARLREAERAENFPVALRVLPARFRTHLRAVYDVVRVIDDLGDEADGDRTAQLEAFAEDLALVWAGGTAAPRSPVLRRLAPTVDVCGLPREPFDRLIAANLQDQRVTHYETWSDLLGYCELSAVPIGRLVLAVFGERGSVPDTATIRASDEVCTALQLLEHWQDVAEDRLRGRTYLPAEDLAAFGVGADDLDAPSAGPALRRLLACETARAVALLDSGAGVVRRMRGWGRLAVGGYVAGGRAAADALCRQEWDVLRRSPAPRRRDVARHLVAELTRSPR
ncbi:squalene synthase HpnC [Pseudonocardia asaccharolytica]|uniref:Phytoene synthase n=1 Tax=Pseudonocardia asaccharolytica DSM 44247 = NBRC 16224 TaxID=1123024 RepID=A0A511CXS2_9PSEU|nr:squalene synthase HpnC [Pseudonocardia asaccharolytica]GEL17342.1 phytoene synthase [Pseudonocardia asaccharolytica DSM 44247 = NBRC 16224]